MNPVKCVHNSLYFLSSDCALFISFLMFCSHTLQCQQSN